MATVVWVPFCGECDHQLNDTEARHEECFECQFNEEMNSND